MVASLLVVVCWLALPDFLHGHGRVAMANTLDPETSKNLVDGGGECGNVGGNCCDSTFDSEGATAGSWCGESQLTHEPINNLIAATCVDQDGTLHGDCVPDLELNIPFRGYDHVDPLGHPSDSPSVLQSHARSFAPSKSLTDSCNMCSSSDFCGDGFCDEELNNAECGWDGGDCCKATCVSSVFDCPTTDTDYVCRDPAHNGLPSTCTVPNPEWIGDGLCDAYGMHNTADCNFDGGDCCENTCVRQDANDPRQCQYFFCNARLPPGCSVSEPAWVGPFFTGLELRPNPPTGCNVPYPQLLGDGWCDGNPDDGYNTEACGWDLGDCCGKTCSSAPWAQQYECGHAGYNCLDPDVPLPPSISSTCQVDHPERLGDGLCDPFGTYNTAACGWDLGDCCQETCEATAWFQPFECGTLPYVCLDPLYSTLRPSIPDGCMVPEPENLGDGKCDGGVYNTQECLWDFGDCCPETCYAANWHESILCGVQGYECLDQSMPKPPEVPNDCLVTMPEYLGDGWCDGHEYNTAECGWDFGDCCNQTCNDAKWYHPHACGSDFYECLDPAVRKPPVIPDGCVVSNPAYLGDGGCDRGEYNTAECGWDLGDCCEKSCIAAVSGGHHQYDCGSSDYECLDPAIPKPPELPKDCLVSNPEYLGDGWCDGGEYNTAECDWEFGDCCNQTCHDADWYHSYECGATGYKCLDPAVRNLPPVPSGCIVSNPAYLGDGGCDSEYNTEECGWDLGDCCEQACLAAQAGGFHQYECGSFGYDCEDPSVRPVAPELCHVPDSSFLGDGNCNGGEYNTEFCGWDLGDCCASSCNEATWYHDFPCGTSGYNCLDPTVDPQPPKPTLPEGCNVAVPENLGNGLCDDGEYNTAECDWDLGDCCQTTCEEAEWFHDYECGSLGFHCLDPSGVTSSSVNILGSNQYEYLSGTYLSGSVSLFNEPVFFSGSLMLYWCGNQGHWTIQLATNIATIETHGCAGQGLRSAPQEDADSLCDSVWKGESGNTLVTMCGGICEPCPQESILWPLTPTALPSLLPSVPPSQLPSIDPSNLARWTFPSKILSEIPAEFPSEFTSEFPPEFPAVA